MPTSLLGSNSYQRQPKQQQHILADGNMNKSQLAPARKRKAHDGGQEEGCMQAAKSKIVPHSESYFQLIHTKLFYLIIIMCTRNPNDLPLHVAIIYYPLTNPPTNFTNQK